MITTLTELEIDSVAGGHFDVAGATYIGKVNGFNNGEAGHYDMYETADGCIVAIWHSGGSTSTVPE